MLQCQASNLLSSYHAMTKHGRAQQPNLSKKLSFFGSEIEIFLSGPQPDPILPHPLPLYQLLIEKPSIRTYH